MANTKKAIFYPRTEGDIAPFYENAAGKLIGPIGAKYGIDTNTIAVLGEHKTNVPLVIQKAYNDKQQAKTSTAAKKKELSKAKRNLLREINRVTGLANWDENDAEVLGIRVTKAPVDINKVKPIISKATSLPTQNILDWIKGAMEGIIVEGIVESEDADTPTTPEKDSPHWTRIGEDLKSPFEDTRPNKSNRPELRHYRIRYVKDDKPVGQYSLVTSLVSVIYPVK